MKPVIPQSELQLRIDNLQKEMRNGDKSAVIIPLGIYFNYFFGKSGEPSERIIAGVIPDEGAPFVLCPTFEMENIRTRTYVEDIVGWDETESAYKKLATELTDHQIGTEIIADPKLWIDEKEKIEQVSNIQIKSGGDILQRQRAIKTEWELKQLRLAAQASSQGIIATLPQIIRGMTELEVVKILASELGARSENPLSFAIVQFGENSAIPHGRPTERKLGNDEVILIDAGTSVNGYHGDITITVPYGKPKNFTEVYDIVYQANRLALEADEPSMIPSQLDQVARDHITNAGYGENFTHRLGHGIGLEVHEQPYIVGVNHIPLIENNCHTIEPGIYQVGKFGVRIEDDVVVTKNGAELLYETPRYNFD